MRKAYPRAPEPDVEISRDTLFLALRTGIVEQLSSSPDHSVVVYALTPLGRLLLRHSLETPGEVPE